MVILVKQKIVDFATNYNLRPFLLLLKIFNKIITGNITYLIMLQFLLKITQEVLIHQLEIFEKDLGGNVVKDFFKKISFKTIYCVTNEK